MKGRERGSRRSPSAGGRSEWSDRGRGGVLPGEPVHAHQPAGVVLVPTLEALYLMLLHAGFREVHLVLPARGAYEAFQTYDRVMLFAYV